MNFKSKYISTLFITLPSVLAAINGKCSSGNGVCISTTSCINSGGTYVRGLCPNDESNVECCNKKCSYNGKSGQCKFISQCNGSSYTDICPGGNDFACCIEDTSSNINNISCTTDNGLKGTCKDISQCNGYVYSGNCPGASNIQCCVSLSKYKVSKYTTPTKKHKTTTKKHKTTIKSTTSTKKNKTTIKSKTTTKKHTTTIKSKSTTKKHTTTIKSKSTTKKHTTTTSKSITTTKKRTTTSKKSSTTTTKKTTTTTKKTTTTTKKTKTTTKKTTTIPKKTTTTTKKTTTTTKKTTTTTKKRTTTTTTTTKDKTTTKISVTTPTNINNKFFKLLTTTNDCVDPTILERNQKFLGFTMVKYMKNTTQKNAISRVDGCSIHKNLIYLVKSLSSSNIDFEPYFTPACNAHDVCYGCGTKKGTCDDKFYENMLKICSEVNTIYQNESLTSSCKEQAYWYYWGVKNFGQSSYENDHRFVDNNKNQCDYCMNTFNLIYTMFLVEGNTIL